MKYFSSNLTHLREKIGKKQSEVASDLLLSRSRYANYEGNHSNPGVDVLEKLAKYYGVTIDDLRNIDLSKNLTPKITAQLTAQNTAQLLNTDIEGKNIRVLAITVDKNGKENIQFVPLAAQAGYLQHIGDPEWVAELPSISLTGFEGGTFRAFEVKGDSMEPTFYPSDRIICRYLEDFTKCRSGERYVIVTEQDGIVVKQVRNLIKQGGLIECISDNTTYGHYTIEASSIKEMWHVKGLFRVSVIGPSNTEERLRQLEKEIKELRSGKK